MRTLDRNKQYIYHATQAGKTEIVDADGYATGQFEILYTDVEKVRMNESAARGTADVEQFGLNVAYTKTLVTSDIHCPISEKTVLWLGFGNLIAHDPDSSYVPGNVVLKGSSLWTCIAETTGEWDNTKWKAVPYNYIVVGVAKSLNSITYAIQEVKVNG